jgi:hypothetical protein
VGPLAVPGKIPEELSLASLGSHGCACTITEAGKDWGWKGPTSRHGTGDQFHLAIETKSGSWGR